MFTLRTTLTFVLIGFITLGNARGESDPLIDAQKQFAKGDLDGALKRLEPLLQGKGVDQQLKGRARDYAARILQARGEEHFREARIRQAIAEFDRRIQLQPDSEPDNWQRGIAYYYAREYEKGARQFDLHRKVNPQDVENAAWHFLCSARAHKGSADAARKNLIAVTSDTRVPMAQIQQMFAGELSPDVVLASGAKTGGAAKFYADLYVGLYYEAVGKTDDSLRLVKSAADNPTAKENYMRDVARVHVTLRSKEAASRQNR